ncbi:hypothetical protein [Bradyrhizobium sp. OAE829]|uniref:hypothetical protein n=1 Tax=Bradyrhizobium sp. OAE829 TaxID=2663807 RepID=UPI00178BC807
MIKPFVGPRLKVARAKGHIEEIHRLTAALYARDPYDIIREQDTETGEYIYRIRIKEAIPCEWGTVIGDIVHNLRAALDQLVCDLVIANDGKVSKTNGFLITETRETFESYLPKKIKGISRRAEWLIRRFKPYLRGGRG